MKNTVVMCFGRMNPPTKGHQAMVKFMEKLGKTYNADVYVYLSHKCQSKDKKDKDELGYYKDPLDYETKVDYCNQAFDGLVRVSEDRTMYQALESLYKEGYTKAIYVCGSDRKDDADRIKKYNGPGKLFNFEPFKVVMFGDSRVDEDLDISAISASRARKAARENDLETFSQIVPFDLETSKELMDKVRVGMGVRGSTRIISEKLNDWLEDIGMTILRNNIKTEIQNFDAVDADVAKIRVDSSRHSYEVLRLHPKTDCSDEDVFNNFVSFFNTVPSKEYSTIVKRDNKTYTVKVNGISDFSIRGGQLASGKFKSFKINCTVSCMEPAPDPKKPESDYHDEQVSDGPVDISEDVDVCTDSRDVDYYISVIYGEQGARKLFTAKRVLSGLDQNEDQNKPVNDQNEDQKDLFIPIGGIKINDNADHITSEDKEFLKQLVDIENITVTSPVFQSPSQVTSEDNIENFINGESESFEYLVKYNNKAEEAFDDLTGTNEYKAGVVRGIAIDFTEVIGNLGLGKICGAKFTKFPAASNSDIFDSYLELPDGTKLNISSKSGDGAKPSISGIVRDVNAKGEPAEEDKKSAYYFSMWLNNNHILKNSNNSSTKGYINLIDRLLIPALNNTNVFSDEDINNIWFNKIVETTENIDANLRREIVEGYTKFPPNLSGDVLKKYLETFVGLINTADKSLNINLKKMKDPYKHVKGTIVQVMSRLLVSIINKSKLTDNLFNLYKDRNPSYIQLYCESSTISSGNITFKFKAVNATKIKMVMNCGVDSKGELSNQKLAFVVVK